MSVHNTKASDYAPKKLKVGDRMGKLTITQMETSRFVAKCDCGRNVSRMIHAQTMSAMCGECSKNERRHSMSTNHDKDYMHIREYDSSEKKMIAKFMKDKKCQKAS